MSHINFVIPQSKAELLTETDEQYYVVDIIGVNEIHSRLKVAKQCLNDEGAEFIIDNFDVYYSVLHYADNLQLDTIYKAYEDLHRATNDLNRGLGLLFEDKESLNDELKIKYSNVLKMLLYIYTNIVNVLDLKHDDKKRQATGMKVKGRKKNVDEGSFACNRTEVLLVLNYILQREISLLWEPPVVDEVFSSMVSEVCYRFLESVSIKSDKETCVELFGFLGTLLKTYNHAMTFVVRLVQLIKIHEHLTACVPEGIQQLVDNYNCKSLVRDLVREITEWQTDEKFTDSKGTRLCANVLSQMAVLMPNLMIPEVMYLNRYLAHDSYTLRNSVLNVIVEVILTVLTKDNLSEEDRESRDEFLNILKEHVNDTSAFVRSKIFAHWGRLQTENAIPLKMQSSILEDAVLHLRDKGAPVRKAAAACVTIFLTHNSYGSKLQLGTLKPELEKELEALSTIKVRLEGIEINKIKEFEAEWLQHDEPFRNVIKEKLEDTDTAEQTEEGNAEADAGNKESYPELIRMYIADKKYSESFDLIRIIGKDSAQFKEMRENMDIEEQIGFYLVFARSIFLDLPAKMAQMAANKTTSGPTEGDLKQLESLERTVDFLQDTVTFLELINNAIIPMRELLQSTSANDTGEAVDFFVAAFQFNIDNAVEGILELLKLMQRNEQDRKDAVLNAFKNIYLTTDSKTMTEHTTIIVSRLIKLLQTVNYNHMQDLTLIIAEWADKGILDNSVIDMLWQYFTGKIEVSENNARASLALLTMIATGRRSTIIRNVKLVSTVGFGDRGKADILLATQACKLLSVAGMETQNLSDKSPPFRLKINESMWTEMEELFVHYFFSNVKFCNPFIKAAIDCIYRLCSKPERFVEKLLEIILPKLSEIVGDTNEIQINMLVRCCILLGEIAIKSYYLLEEVIYKEMKRRAFIREERKNDTKVGHTKKNKKTPNSRNATNSTTNTSAGESGTNDETQMEGASGTDLESEFVMHILEHQTVTSAPAPLAQFADMIINICKQSATYDNEYLQCAATTALLRYMLISNRFCEKQMQLIFTIVGKSQYESVKNIIIIHCSDLLEKSPNIVEPYTYKLYERFKDPSINVRKTAFFMLANLILRDMIRVKGYMSEMAQCLIDPEPELQDMAKNFFMLLSQKANNLYNVVPDIFSHLCENVKENDLQTIMQFIFNLIDKNKQMENLVDRFCAKFKVSDDETIAKNIAFCLSLINYNEKGFKKLIENFSLYKHNVLNTETFVIFKKIINTYNKPTSKPEMKALTVELDEKIKQMFEITDGAVIPQVTTKKTDFKKPKGRPVKAAKGRKKQMDSSGDSSDTEEENEPVSSKSQKKGKFVKSKGRGGKKTKYAKHSDSSDESD